MDGDLRMRRAGPSHGFEDSPRRGFADASRTSQHPLTGDLQNFPTGNFEDHVPHGFQTVVLDFLWGGSFEPFTLPVTPKGAHRWTVRGALDGADVSGSFPAV